MTSKLTINRERLQEIAEDGFLKHGESKELARMALAAMDCEPVAVVDIQRGRGDGRKYALCYTSAGHSLPDDVYNLYVAPQPASAVGCEPVAHVDPHCVHNIIWTDYGVALENIGVGAPLFAAPHPAPVVPDAEAVYARLSDHEKWSTSLENVNHVLNACRAAMLAASPQPPGSDPATVSGGWIPVSERMPLTPYENCPYEDVEVQVFAGEDVFIAHYAIGALPEPWGAWVDTAADITHWQPLAAAPQEVK